MSWSGSVVPNPVVPSDEHHGVKLYTVMCNNTLCDTLYSKIVLWGHSWRHTNSLFWCAMKQVWKPTSMKWL